MEEKKEAASAAPISQYKDSEKSSLSNILFNFSLLDSVNTEAEKAMQPQMKIGMFVVKTANQTIKEAALRPNPDPLWMSLWYEGEVCCLFADSNVGKSIYAVQIANEIAKSKKVLYFDFELSDKQFQLRYTDSQGYTFVFPENLYRVEIDRDSLNTETFEDVIVDNIENTAISTEAKILIIDNLTYLCIASEKGDLAGALMMRLIGLKKKYDLSILVLAHTPKRPLTNPITPNDLAGSKKLYNFFDSAFAIGKSVKDTNLRYIKQVKVRFGNYDYDSDNVIVCSIEKESTFLHFSQIGFADEREHLKEFTEKDKTETVNTVKQLSIEGRTQREIAKMLCISVGCVNKYLKK
jgi:hypothetical protein